MSRSGGVGDRGMARAALVAGRAQWSVATLLDAAPLGFVFGVLLLATGKPIFAGVVVFALAPVCVRRPHAA